MKYEDGTLAFIGDELSIWEGMNGKIVCDFEKKVFLEGYAQSDWSTEMKGIMVLSEAGDLFHFEELNEDIVFIARGS